MTDDIREKFGAARMKVEQLLERSSTDPAEIMRLHTADVDEIVIAAFESALAGSGRDPGGVALIALGGYGRQELAPNSDLDLLLLHSGWSSTDANSLNREIMYPLWDSGRELGDRIRETREVFATPDRIDEICALLDLRLLAGDRGLFSGLTSQVGAHLERIRDTFFKRLIDASRERHNRYGHAGHLLEPNIRDSAGGLRDIHTLAWASRLLPGPDGMEGLVASSHLSQIDFDLITRARTFMFGLRIELHLVTNRHQDQLFLAEQDEVARRLGYEEIGQRPAAERLMQQLYLHAREVDVVVDSFWARVPQRKRRRFRRTETSEAIGDGCVIQSGHIDVVAVTPARTDPAGWLRVFLKSVRHSAPLSRAALNRLHVDIEGATDIEWTPEARALFIELLQAGPDGINALQTMDIAGFLSALIPEWEHIRAYPQRDLYHRYTVDRHLMAAVAELASSRDSTERDVRDAWALIDDGAALFVATLLHDMGKGRDGDHSVIGAELAVAVGRRMLLEEDDVADVVFLVRDHLMLAEAAVRRDLGDPATISDVADRVGDLRRLGMLYLLTRSDSIATGPEAWSSFRSSLIRELYLKVRQRFEGGDVESTGVSVGLDRLMDALALSREEVLALVGPMPEAWLAGIEFDAARRQIALMRAPLEHREIRTSVHNADEADEFVLIAHDRPGLFSVVTGVLALRGIEVHDAEIYTRSDGVAVEVFRVVGSHGEIPADRWTRVREDIRSVLDGELDLDGELGRKETQTRRRQLPGRGETRSQVVIDDSASGKFTVVEVHTGDRFGLLRLITKVLADAGCDLSLAKVATYGAHVVDVFYLHDLEGQKITDPDHVRRIEAGLWAALGETPDQAR